MAPHAALMTRDRRKGTFPVAACVVEPRLSHALGRGARVANEESSYRCSFCGAVLIVPAHAQVRSVIESGSERVTERVLLVDGEETHRCTVGPGGR